MPPLSGAFLRSRCRRTPLQGLPAAAPDQAPLQGPAARARRMRLLAL